MIKNKVRKALIFDMDGTIYKFKEGSFRSSNLNKEILENARLYIMEKLNKNKEEASKLLKEIKKEYGEHISIALEQNFGLDRYEYFNKTWNIPAKKYIRKDPGLAKIFKKLKKNFTLVLLSDAPKVWIKNVLEELNLKDIFDNNIYSGDGNVRKGFHNAFKNIINKLKLKPSDCIVFGDQEETDIIPAKKKGLKTVFVGKKKSSYADYSIKNIKEIEEFLKERKEEIWKEKNY